MMRGMETIGLEDLPYESRMVNEATLAAAESEDVFAEEAFEMNKELGQTVPVIGGLLRTDTDGQPRTLDRNEAILAGLLVRCAKIQHGVLQSCNPPRAELLNFFSRGLTESAINLRYLIEHGTPAIFDAFVRYSLSADKKLHEQIQAAVAARGGTVLPIEERMLDGIERTFAVAGMSLEQVSTAARGWSPEGIWGRFKALGREDSYALFEIGSHYVHGNWHDLYAYHLNVGEDGGFEVAQEFGTIRPQILTVTIIVLVDACLAYLATFEDCDDREVLADRVTICSEKARQIDALHETFLARQSRGS
jgi:hypothetical protein